VPVITVLTDFGLAGTYVGQLKGAILAVTQAVTLVDLTHALSPQDVLGGAFLLWSAVEAFPAGSIHVAVVDPGVGSARRAIALRSGRGDLFVGPDNGVLIPAVDRLGGCQEAVALTDPRYWRSAVSSTFHGRDVFGPVAGHLARGVPLNQFGSAIDDWQVLSLPEPQGLSGEVLHVDTYGNLITNLPAASLPERFQARVGSAVAQHATHYAAAPPGALLALVGSTGVLEISARNTSAAEVTGGTRGTPVTVEAL
jgi:S-adenosylmethionine hydrolase